MMIALYNKCQPEFHVRRIREDKSTFIRFAEFVSRRLVLIPKNNICIVFFRVISNHIRQLRTHSYYVQLEIVNTEYFVDIVLGNTPEFYNIPEVDLRYQRRRRKRNIFFYLKKNSTNLFQCNTKRYIFSWKKK